MQHQLSFAVNTDAHKEPFRGILRQAQDDTDEVGFVGLAPITTTDYHPTKNGNTPYQHS